jgi:hypothetical protein
MPNVRDQRRRAVGAPLAWESLWVSLAVPASGVTTSDDRCIALLGGAESIVRFPFAFPLPAAAMIRVNGEPKAMAARMATEVVLNVIWPGTCFWQVTKIP